MVGPIGPQDYPAKARWRTRQRELRGFYTNLAAYVVVCSLLVVIDLVRGSGEYTFIGLDWAYWPVIVWGLFVLIHALRVLPVANRRTAEDLYEKKRHRTDADIRPPPPPPQGF